MYNNGHCVIGRTTCVTCVFLFYCIYLYSFAVSLIEAHIYSPSRERESSKGSRGASRVECDKNTQMEIHVYVQLLLFVIFFYFIFFEYQYLVFIPFFFGRVRLTTQNETKMVFFFQFKIIVF